MYLYSKLVDSRTDSIDIIPSDQNGGGTPPLSSPITSPTLSTTQASLTTATETLAASSSLNGNNDKNNDDVCMNTSNIYSCSKLNYKSIILYALYYSYVHVHAVFYMLYMCC